MQSTYIGGQIINPTLDYVIFSNGDKVLDTVMLDSNNFFEYRTEKIKAGLHFFSHSEGQVFYIEPGDSLLMHLNTIDFDESLAYSGKGSEQNNLLMDLYLQNEIENRNLPNWYDLSSKEFERKIDSIKKEKTKEYEDFIKQNKVANDFKNIALANIQYDYYSKKEMYAAANRSTSEKLGKNYYDYRKKIDFNRNDLRFYYPYYRFMNRYFDNIVCSRYDTATPPDRKAFDYSFRKIQIIDSLVTSDSIKNRLVRYNTMYYLLNASNSDEEKQLYETFKKINTDQKNLDEVTKLYEATVRLTPGNIIPNVLLVNTDNVLMELESVIKAPTVLYFWSGQPSIQHQNQHRRAAELKSKYPEYDFIGVNTDTHFKKWRSIIYQSKYDSKYEYQVENLTDAQKNLLLKYINNVLIVDEGGVILDGKINMFNVNFEQKLLGYLNKK